MQQVVNSINIFVWIIVSFAIALLLSVFVGVIAANFTKDKSLLSGIVLFSGLVMAAFIMSLLKRPFELFAKFIVVKIFKKEYDEKLPNVEDINYHG